MARCGCSGSCDCRIQDGSFTTVNGSGTPDDPYTIDADFGFAIDNSGTVTLTLTGTGTGADPYVLKADGGGGGPAAGAVLYNAPQTLTAGERGQAEANLGFFVTPEQYGCQGDGVTNDTVNMQAAVDALAALGGGILYCSARTYVIGGLVMKAGVVLTGQNTGKMSSGKYSTRFIPPAGYTGWIIDTPGGAIVSCAVVGIAVIGFNGSPGTTHTGGIRYQNVSWGVISNVEVGNTSLGCVKLMAGAACLIRDNNLQNFWQYRPALSANEAVLYVSGTDHIIRGNQCNGGDNSTVLDTANFYRCGLLLNAWTSWVFDGNGEYSDVGIKVTGKLNKLTSCRADVNAGPGIIVEYIGNILSDVTVISNSCGSSGTYDGIYLGALAYNTTIDGVTSGDFLGVKHRYVVNDAVSIGGDWQSASLLPIIENVQAIDNSYAIDLIAHSVGMRAMLPPGAGDPQMRPPSRHCHGNCWYDTVNNKPTFSNGVVWRDAGGDVSGNLLTVTLSTMLGAATSQTNMSGWARLTAGTTLGLVDGWTAFKRPKALSMVNSGAVNVVAAQIPYFAGIIAGKTYSFCVYTRAVTTAATVTITYQWFDASLVAIGSPITPAGALNSTAAAATLFAVTGVTAPAGATGVNIVVTCTRTGMPSGEEHQISKVGIITPSSSNYVSP